MKPEQLDPRNSIVFGPSKGAIKVSPSCKGSSIGDRRDRGVGNDRADGEAIAFPGLLIWRIGGDFFFASAGHVSEALIASLAVRQDVKRVLLDFGPVNFIDISASDELLSVIEKLQSPGITVAFARVRDVVRDDMLR